MTLFKAGIPLGTFKSVCDLGSLSQRVFYYLLCNEIQENIDLI